MSLAIGIVGLVLAIIDVYFPSTKARIERFLDRQAVNYRQNLRRVMKIAAGALAIGVVGLIAAYIVGEVYEPALPDRPQPESFEEAVGQIIADALGFAIGKMLVVVFVLVITLVIILVLVVLAVPFLVAPLSRFLNAITGGHAFAGLGLLLGVTALLTEFA